MNLTVLLVLSCLIEFVISGKLREINLPHGFKFKYKTELIPIHLNLYDHCVTSKMQKIKQTVPSDTYYDEDGVEYDLTKDYIESCENKLKDRVDENKIPKLVPVFTGYFEIDFKVHAKIVADKLLEDGQEKYELIPLKVFPATEDGKGDTGDHDNAESHTALTAIENENQYVARITKDKFGPWEDKSVRICMQYWEKTEDGYGSQQSKRYRLRFFRKHIVVQNPDLRPPVPIETQQTTFHVEVGDVKYEDNPDYTKKKGKVDAKDDITAWCKRPFQEENIDKNQNNIITRNDDNINSDEHGISVIEQEMDPEEKKIYIQFMRNMTNEDDEMFPNIPQLGKDQWDKKYNVIFNWGIFSDSTTTQPDVNSAVEMFYGQTEIDLTESEPPSEDKQTEYLQYQATKLQELTISEASKASILALGAFTLISLFQI